MLKQRSAEKGQTAREQSAREYDEHKACRDTQQQLRSKYNLINKLATKQPRASVARNLDGEATKLAALPGPHASAITKLSNRAQKVVLNNKGHVACLEALKGEFGDRLMASASATTTPRLLKAFLNALYVREVDVLPPKLGLEM